VTLTAEQRTRIQQTVLASSNVPRVDNVNFSLSVGTVVPASVRVVEVPETLIEIHPRAVVRVLPQLADRVIHSGQGCKRHIVAKVSQAFDQAFGLIGSESDWSRGPDKGFRP
jgi:hypothetical protein